MTDDLTLTTKTVPPHKQGQVLVIACGAIAREILAVNEANGWSHIALTCLPAIYHVTPEKIPGAVQEAVEKHKDDYDRIFVAYADCGTGGILQSTCEDLGVEMISGPHCYSFFEGNETFAARDEVTVFYLTDFLARQFDAFVWEPLGLDKHPELLPMYFGNYTKLVFQIQKEDPALLEKARDCADRLGLEFEARFTGYGDLTAELAKL